MMVGAGDDYEILAAVAPENTDAFELAARSGGVQVRRIGQLNNSRDVRFLAPGGEPLELRQRGYDHF